ncbi:Hypothetical protein GLP15_5185 [Giardia lamblia P15]|uniref:Uncharacterized protein n=1 Tax=Giardia intestinalis (strain P15) TaxID=658858 RepID=E1EWB4_GIAIA|nr:Hypothetical protein GLP15_5185 [Giardia lamblia P15]
MPKDDAHVGAIVVPKQAVLGAMLDSIQVVFPAVEDVLANIVGTVKSRLQMNNSAPANMSVTSSTTGNVIMTTQRFSLWMLQRIIIAWINCQPGSTLKRLLRCMLISNRYYSSVCNFVLYNIADKTKATLVDKLLLRPCPITSTPPILSESFLGSKQLVNFFAESSEEAWLYFQIDAHLGCLQLRCMHKQKANYFGIFLLDCSRQLGEPQRWQNIIEVKYLIGDQIRCPRLFDIIHIKHINKTLHDRSLYEVSIVLCTNTSVYFITFVLSVSSNITIHDTCHVYKSHSTTGFLGTLFDKQEMHAKQASALLPFFYRANVMHEYPYLCIISPFLPLLFAVSGRFLEPFFLERRDGGCTILGVVTNIGQDPIIVTAEGKVYRVSIASQQECKGIPRIILEEVQTIDCTSVPWTVAMTPYTIAMILEQGRVLATDQDGDQTGVIERQVFEEICRRDNSVTLKALALLKSIKSPLIRDIVSIGLLRISKTIVYVIAAGKTWDGSGFLAIYDTIKWSIRTYDTVFPVAQLRGGKTLVRLALLDSSLLCGLN